MPTEVRQYRAGGFSHGGDVIIAGSVSNDEARKLYPQGWKEPKPYIRIVPQPVLT